MVSFSKPIQGSADSDGTLPAKRKRTLNYKLASEDNVHLDAVKRRKFLTSQQKTTGSTASTTSKIPFRSASQNSQPSVTSKHHSSRQGSVEEVDDNQDHAYPPKKPNAILEDSDSDDNIEYVGRASKDPVTPVQLPVNDTDNEDIEKDSNESGEDLQEETDEQELGNL